MDEDFERTAKKQGVNPWDKLQALMSL
ncbi:unnamed protein product [Calypogeia fissa]